MYTTKKCHWTNHDIRVLGIDIPSNIKNLNKANYQEIIKKVTVTIQDWSHRELSILGKVMVLNGLVGSWFVYCMAVVQEITRDVVQELNSVMNAFFGMAKDQK